MKFPWHKYEEVAAQRRNTLQIFITNNCNLRCRGCFARNVMGVDNTNIGIQEYEDAILNFIRKGGKQVNLLGGEPLLHPNLLELLNINREFRLKTTIYTNGVYLLNYSPEDFKDIKIRISIYSCHAYSKKSSLSILNTEIPFDANYMVAKDTTVEHLLKASSDVEKKNCKVFFISSIRELDNDRKEFFDDTELTMPLLEYKELVHNFLEEYDGEMDIHISKRGVFESTLKTAVNKCHFVNYFIGGKIIQCPYDVINLRFQEGYDFNKRFCQKNNTCLMSKIIVRRKNG